MLSHSLEQEKKAREEMTNQQLESNVRQLRHSLEKGWLNGAPSDAENEEFHKLAISLSIPENVEQSLRREVKLKMSQQCREGSHSETPAAAEFVIHV